MEGGVSTHDWMDVLQIVYCNYYVILQVYRVIVDSNTMYVSPSVLFTFTKVLYRLSKHFLLVFVIELVIELVIVLAKCYFVGEG